MTPDSWFWRPWDRFSGSIRRWREGGRPCDVERAIGEQRAWRSATDLKQLGMLGAEWLIGNVETHSTLEPFRRPDPETEHLVDILARLNRAGFVTIDSQPGLMNGYWRGAYWHQRAFVHGFASPELVEALLAGTVGVGLNLTSTTIRRQPGARPRGCYLHDLGGQKGTAATGWSTIQLMPSRMPPLQREVTWIDTTLNRADVRNLFYDLSDEAWAALFDSRFLTIYDTTWGREDVLWAALDAALDEIDIQRRGFVNTSSEEVP